MLSPHGYICVRSGLCDYVFFNGISCLVVELLGKPLLAKALASISAIFVAFVI